MSAIADHASKENFVVNWLFNDVTITLIGNLDAYQENDHYVVIFSTTTMVYN